MTSLNRASLIGNLGRDPEIRTTQAGKSFANLSVATTDKWKDRNSGERREQTEWHRVVVFAEATADFCERYLHKGDQVLVEGKIRTRKWTDKDGQDKYSTEIVVEAFGGRVDKLGRNESGGSGQGQREESEPARQTGGAAGARPGAHDDLDDEIPF